MNATEAAQLLLILSSLDRREYNATTAQAWAWALEDVPLALGIAAARTAFKAGGYVDVQAIQKEITLMRPRIEADIRSAKERGLINRDWPKTQPLTDEIQTALIAARKREYEATNDPPDEIASNGAFHQLDR